MTNIDTGIPTATNSMYVTCESPYVGNEVRVDELADVEERQGLERQPDDVPEQGHAVGQRFEKLPATECRKLRQLGEAKPAGGCDYGRHADFTSVKRRKASSTFERSSRHKHSDTRRREDSESVAEYDVVLQHEHEVLGRRHIGGDQVCHSRQELAKIRQRLIPAGTAQLEDEPARGGECHQFRHGAQEPDVALIEQRDGVREPCDLLEPLRCPNDRAPSRGRSSHEVTDTPRALGIEVVSRLVDQQHGRRREEGTRYGKPLLHPCE